MFAYVRNAALYALLLLALLLLAPSSIAQATSATIDINREPPQPQSTACGDIVRSNLYEQDRFIFTAEEAFNCLTSVPFNSAVALRFLHYLNTTLQFQSTTAFLRNPPPSYQQPPVDVFGVLQELIDRVDAGVYRNEYAFETDLQQLLQRMHDTHVVVYGGIWSVFSFLSPYNLVSASRDGKELPEVYISDDLIAQTTGAYTASAVIQINGRPATDYLKDFAALQSAGTLEPHADWNQLMTSPAQFIFGVDSFSEAAPFYPGNDLTFTLANGTVLSTIWLALYDSPGYTGPLETGGDFYNYFVLGLLPANYEAEAELYYQSRSASSAEGTSDSPIILGDDDSIGGSVEQTSWHEQSSAYPRDTMMHQADLGEFTEGIVTGYFLSDSSTAVLSIPSFAQYDDAISTFSDAVNDFFSNATARNASRVIIDLQQNTGGLVALVFFLFDKFFPNSRPYTGSRMRSHHLGNILGQAQTAKFQSTTPDYDDPAYLDTVSSEWVATTRLNADTGRNFTSWQQFAGPVSANGDTFTVQQEYDLSNPTFLESAFGVEQTDPCYYTQTCDLTSPWEPQDIVILTDGLCASACTLFMEMMRERGVRSVAVGGLPQEGPMQAQGGTRGAILYDGTTLDIDYATAAEWNATAGAALPVTPSDTGISLTYVGFNLRDQMMPNATTPNQVLFLPADCRLYWSFANFNNYEQLWKDVATAMFVDSSFCVSGSVNVTTAPVRPTAPDLSLAPKSSFSPSASLDSIDDGSLAFIDGTLRQSISICSSASSRGACTSIALRCRCDGTSCQTPKPFAITTTKCRTNAQCGGQRCKISQNVPIGSQNNIAASEKSIAQGNCVPNWTKQDQSRGCRSLTPTSLQQILSGQDPSSS